MAAAQGQDQARRRYGRRRRGERGGRRGHRGGPARIRAARRRDLGGGQLQREHSRERHVVFRVVVILFVGGVAIGDLGVGGRYLGRVVMAGAGAADQDGWLTTTVRPAGAVDDAALARLSEALGVLEPGSDMVVIDLTAADVRDPGRLARHLRAPARRFDQAGRCLLLVGASAGLMAELRRAAVPVVTLGADASYDPAA